MYVTLYSNHEDLFLYESPYHLLFPLEFSSLLSLSAPTGSYLSHTHLKTFTLYFLMKTNTLPSPLSYTLHTPSSLRVTHTNTPYILILTPTQSHILPPFLTHQNTLFSLPRTLHTLSSLTVTHNKHTLHPHSFTHANTHSSSSPNAHHHSPFLPSMNTPSSSSSSQTQTYTRLLTMSTRN